jgi:hypothetical protein
VGWPVRRLGRLLRLEGAFLDGPRRCKHNHNRHLHHRPGIAVPRALGDSLDCPGVPEMIRILIALAALLLAGPAMAVSAPDDTVGALQRDCRSKKVDLNRALRDEVSMIFWGVWTFGFRNTNWCPPFAKVQARAAKFPAPFIAAEMKRGRADAPLFLPARAPISRRTR